MKNSKIVLILVSFIIINAFPAFSQAKIPDGVLGVKFGSSPTETKTIMSKKEGYPKGYSKDENKVLEYKPDLFAGNPCHEILFLYTNKKLYSVMIHLRKGREAYGDYNTFEKIHGELCEKYGETKANRSASGNSIIYYAIWEDEENLIQLRLDGDSHIWIYYINKKLAKEAQEEEKKNKNEY